MANDCLVTKLKAAVDADLPKLGVIRLKAVALDSITNENQLFIYMAGTGDGCKVTIVGDGSFTVDNDATVRTEFTLDDGHSYTLKFINGNYDIEIDNKYYLKILAFNSNYYKHLVRPYVSDLAYCTRLETFNARKVTLMDGSLADLKHCTAMKTMIVNDSEGWVDGNLSDLSGMSDLETIDFDVPSNILASGSIDALKDLTHLRSIRFNRTTAIVGDASVLGKLPLETFSIASTGITGGIEGFVAAQVNNWHTSGELYGQGLLQVLTFGGNKERQDYQCHLEWSSASHMAVYTGDSNKANCTIVNVLGYTESEIAALKSAGKTVWSYENGSWVQK